ncbi:MAG TPA: hypothetical protein VIE67_13745 [Rudaea sp.]
MRGDNGPIWNFTRRETVMMQPTGDFVVGWGTLTLINAGLAQAKGRSGLGWWLASLFIGPIATLLIVVLGPVR